MTTERFMMCRRSYYDMSGARQEAGIAAVDIAFFQNCVCLSSSSSASPSPGPRPFELGLEVVVILGVFEGGIYIDIAILDTPRQTKTRRIWRPWRPSLCRDVHDSRDSVVSFAGVWGAFQARHAVVAVVNMPKSNPMTEPYSLFATKNPRLVTRKWLQLIAWVDLGLGAARMCLFRLAVLIHFAESLLLKGSDILSGNGNGGWLSTKHREYCLKGMDDLSREQLRIVNSKVPKTLLDPRQICLSNCFDRLDHPDRLPHESGRWVAHSKASIEGYTLHNWGRICGIRVASS